MSIVSIGGFVQTEFFRVEIAFAMRILVLALAVTFALVSPAVAEDLQKSMAERVEEELVRVQSYTGETFDRLLALGPDAVPELCKHLESYAFPAVIIWVASERQEPRAVPALIRFIENGQKLLAGEGQASPTDEKRKALRELNDVEAVKALREIGDPRAEGLLASIVKNPTSDISLRFEANAALARLGSPDVKARAAEEMMRMYRTGEGLAEEAWPNPDVILYQDFYVGLCEVQTDEAESVLAAFIRVPGEGYKKQPVIRLLGRREETRGRQKIVEAILHAAEHEQEYAGYDGGFTLTRFEALVALHRLKGAVAAERLRKVAQDLADDGFAESDDPYWRRNVELFNRIKQDLDAELAKTPKAIREAANGTYPVASTSETPPSPRVGEASSSSLTPRALEPIPLPPEASSARSSSETSRVSQKKTFVDTLPIICVAVIAASALTGLLLLRRRVRIKGEQNDD